MIAPIALRMPVPIRFYYHIKLSIFHREYRITGVCERNSSDRAFLTRKLKTHQFRFHAPNLIKINYAKVNSALFVRSHAAEISEAYPFRAWVLKGKFCFRLVMEVLTILILVRAFWMRNSC
jgi:hypothetical protein